MAYAEIADGAAALTLGKAVLARRLILGKRFDFDKPCK